MKKILISRAVDLALDDSKKLQNLGYEVISLPLTKILPLRNLEVNWQKIEQSDIVIITSAAVFNDNNTTILEKISSKDLYVIGKKTASLAQIHNCSSIKYIAKDSADLCNNLPQDKSQILYLCGKNRLMAIENFLQKKAYNYYLLELYDHIIDSLNLEKIIKGNVNLRDIDYALIYCGLNAVIFNQIAEFLSKNIKLLCFSSRIANYLDKNIFQYIYIAKEPNSQKIYDLLYNLNKTKN